MSRLIVKSGKGSIAYNIDKDILTIGRNPTNDIVINEPSMSREHAKLSRRGIDVLIHDLDSMNGVFVNQLRVKNEILEDGDEIRIGTTIFAYEERATQEVVLSDEKISFHRNHTIVKSVKDNPFKDLVIGQESKTKDAEHSKVRIVNSFSVPIDNILGKFTKTHLWSINDFKRAYRNLLILYHILESLNKPNDLKELLNLIMEMVLEALSAERGFLMLIDPRKGDLIPMVVINPVEESRKEIAISKSIVNKVLDDKVSILISDAAVDPRFQDQKSVMLHNIRSVMCVPLWNGQKIIGVIHIDSSKLTNQFGESDLDLLTAIGNQAAIVIEKARLQKKIQREIHIRSNLERFHSPAVVDLILAESSKAQSVSLDVKEQEATILFSDIKGFTKLAEGLSPKDIAHLLNDYFSVMSEVIFEYEGTLDKYIGDAIMAIFGAPVSYDNHAERAVLAGLKMQEEMKKMTASKQKNSEFQVKIGINTGKVVAGNIGSLKRMEYTVLGDVVNIASRLESLAPPGRVLIGYETYKRVQGLFKIKPMGAKKVRGRDKSVLVYEVVARMKT